MSIDGRNILWPSGCRIERGIAYLFAVLSAALGVRQRELLRVGFDEYLAMERFNSRSLCVQLPASLAYAGHFETRTSSIDSQVKVFDNEAAALTPLESDNACIIVQKHAELSTNVQFLQLRNDTLGALERQAERLGIDRLILSSDARPTLHIQHPGTAAKRHLERKSLTLGFALLLAGLWSVMTVLQTRAETALGLVSSEESRLRTALLERLDENRELSALGQLAAIHPEMRSPQGRLQSLSNVTTATTDSTWWQHIELDDTTLRLTGRSESASASLLSVSAAFSDYDVSFADAVADTPDGDQIFTLEIRPWETLR